MALTNEQLAIAISTCACQNTENINLDTQTQLPEGSAIYVCPIGLGGKGIDGDQESKVAETLAQISEQNAAKVNDLITTPYRIISQNGYPT